VIRNPLPDPAAVPVVEIAKMDFSAWRSPLASHVALLAQALAMSDRLEDSLGYALIALSEGRAGAVEIRVNGTLAGLAVIEAATCKSGAYLNVWALSGHDRATWLPALLEWLDHAAEIGELKGVRLGGRVGWERLLKDSGYRVYGVLMEKLRQ